MRYLPQFLLVSLLIAATGLVAQNNRWVKLGSMRVSDQTEKDTLSVGADKGTFEAVRLGARGRAIQFHDVKIHFVNGDVQDAEVRDVVRAGQWTRAIDLKGDDRRIDRIVMKYDAQTARRGRGAVIAVHGRQ